MPTASDLSEIFHCTDEMQTVPYVRVVELYKSYYEVPNFFHGSVSYFSVVLKRAVG